MSKAKRTLRASLTAWLKEQGHITAVSVTDERFSEIRFRSRGLSLFVRVDEHDPHFLYILLKAQLPENVCDELLARRAAAAVEARSKVAKVELQWDARECLIAAEQFVTTPGGADIFWRAVTAISESYHHLHKALDEEIGRAAASEFTAQLEEDLTRGAR